MKAVQILGDISSPEIFPNWSMEKPKPKGSQILIHVHAAGITGDEIIWPEPYASPTRIPGHEISGVICEFGPDYTGSLIVGQEVFAFLGANRGQGQAEYAICLPDEVALKPKSISHAEAAALPIPVLTAREALTDHGSVKSGMKVLITGASGAVGVMAVQLLARMDGMEVVALASARNHEMVKDLGAHEVLDYNFVGWEREVQGADVVFDTVGGDVLAKAWECVKDDGVIVTVGDPAPAWAFGGGQAPESIDRPRVRYEHFIVSPNTEWLGDGSEMIDDGSLRKLSVQAFPFGKAKEAWAYARERGRKDKVVIVFED
ncbi:hypothetical protein N7478_001933 [Penicillium angulare]|uniref:uncharacterized protein n=1 Tax=Penicillium angulare TaxID=116970 RepID=UPI00253FA7FA|nr:uncharacterized protein N7478_001933 [Penicillium angulare]KAJ5288903.1 hypothetical protein N7478_001933 [Penicillium angulare]